MLVGSFSLVLMTIVAITQVSTAPLPNTFAEGGNLGVVRPPTGWVEQSVLDFPNVSVKNSFYDAKAPSQRILLGIISMTAGSSLSSVVDKITTALSGEHHANLISSQPTRLCDDGSASGWSLRYTEAGWYVVETILVGRFHGTAAIYLRKPSDSEDPTALRAIRAACIVPAPK